MICLNPSLARSQILYRRWCGADSPGSVTEYWHGGICSRGALGCVRTASCSLGKECRVVFLARVISRNTAASLAHSYIISTVTLFPPLHYRVTDTPPRVNRHHPSCWWVLEYCQYCRGIGACC